MNCTRWSALALALALLSGLAACGNDQAGDTVLSRQTKFPGMVSAGGGTSGEVMARAKGAQGTSAAPEGTPGIPQGAGGNVGGAALGGTVSQDTPLGGSGQKTPEQAREGSLPQTAPSVASPPADAASPAAGAASR